MIYDCFSFFTEIDLLDIRLHHHWDKVDYFVIIEGDRTFAGKPIESTLKKHWDRYKWASDKIIPVTAKMLENPSSRWENEAIQRNSVPTEIMDDGDTVIWSCVDEIFRHSAIDKMEEMVVSQPVLNNYYYYLNGKDILHPEFPTPVSFRKAVMGDRTVHEFWERRHMFDPIPDAGWHFSFLGGPEAIKQKFESFSHAEYDTDYFKDPKRLAEAIEKGEDIMDRDDHRFEYVDINGDFPRYIKENQDKFAHLIHA